MRSFFFLFWHFQKIRQVEMPKWIILIKCLQHVQVMIVHVNVNIHSEVGLSIHF